MSSFLYEQLDPERFQMFAQALVLAESPGLQCLPIGQPDGGADGLLLPAFGGHGDLIAVQIKYVRNPQSMTDPHKWLVKQLKGEAPKVASLLGGRVSRYVLITNVAGTAHPKTGSYAKLQALLDETLPVPSMALWRDDLDRRVEAFPAIKWSYPEITRGVDLLELLVDSDLGSQRRRRADAIRAFVAEQYEIDEEVRFKQVELQNDLLSLFIDVPAELISVPGISRGRRDSNPFRPQYSARSDVELRQRLMTDERRLFADSSEFPSAADGPPGAGAAALLLSDYGQNSLRFVVLEGAPGQGKSTLAQFICQVHRMKMRNSDRLESLSAAHRTASQRLPIKVDLTEYASWQSGVTPFNVEEGDGEVPRGGARSLESFVSALISFGSGGATFDVDDLHAVMRNSSILLVLDGLDEVAEVKRRDAVIKEINSAARRLAELAPTIQVVVTTRPSAFAGVSEISTKNFVYLQLGSVSKALSADYAKRWTTAKKLPPREASALQKSLASRLDQPHVRDLATNPMQLAILLSVVHSRGSSLPDKRTALYDIYVELFLARESEKTPEVREHSDLLVDVHQYLAWTLQSMAERGTQLGRIDVDSLMSVLQSYLLSEGRNPALADELFKGAQRVVFLVARVEGTFEFEVQPLREYFAGKYLYTTSPYSPTGRERGGTMPDRFDALCRNPYWLNATRFFAGSLNKGELPALVDRIHAFAEDDDFRHISYPRYLATVLLSDWVFGQHQRSLQSVVDLILDGPGVRSIIRASEATRRSNIRLPSGAGRPELLEGSFKALASMNANTTSVRALAMMLQANATATELVDLWDRWSASASGYELANWLNIAYYLGILRLIDPSRIDELVGTEAIQQVIQNLYNGAHKIVARSEGLSLAFIDNVMSNEVVGGVRARRGSQITNVIGLLSGSLPYKVFDSGAPDMARVGQLLIPNRDLRARKEVSQPIEAELLLPENMREHLERLEALLGQLMTEPVGRWRSTMQPWVLIIDELAEIRSGRSAAILQVSLAASRCKDTASAKHANDLFDDSINMALRLRAARSRAGNTGWWRRVFEHISDDSDRFLACFTYLAIAGPTVIAATAAQYDFQVRLLSANQLQSLAEQLPKAAVNRWLSRSRLELSELPDTLEPSSAALLARVTPVRVARGLLDKYLQEVEGNDGAVRRVVMEILFREILHHDSLSETHWKTIIKVTSDLDAATSFNVDRIVGLRLGHGRVSMPIEIAQEIVRSPASLPDALRSAAETVCEREIFEKTEPLAVIAERDDWFGNL